MKKESFSYLTAVLLIGLGTVAAIVVISLFGENNKINVTADYFLESLRDKKYATLPMIYSTSGREALAGGEESMLFHFLLEMSLQHHFGVLDQDDYLVASRRQAFWIPFIGPERMEVAVSLRKRDDDNWLRYFVDRPAAELTGLLTLVREGGAWKIERVNLGQSGLAPEYAKMAAELDAKKYVEITDTGISLKANEIKLAELDPQQRKIIVYSLQKALEVLVSERKNDAPGGLLPH